MSYPLDGSYFGDNIQPCHWGSPHDTGDVPPDDAGDVPCMGRSSVITYSLALTTTPYNVRTTINPLYHVTSDSVVVN